MGAKGGRGVHTHAGWARAVSGAAACSREQGRAQRSAAPLAWLMPPSQRQSTQRKGQSETAPRSTRRRRAGARGGSSAPSRATASGYSRDTSRAATADARRASHAASRSKLRAQGVV
jgi:hypothetical protein